MTVTEDNEIRAWAESARVWLEEMGTPRFLSNQHGEPLYDRAWDLARVLRLAYIRGRVDERAGADYPVDKEGEE